MTNLCVVARVCPLFASELGDAAQECITVRSNQLLLTDIKDAQYNYVADNRRRRRIFTFDHIFAAQTDSENEEGQKQIFECVGQEALSSILDGYNSSLFAYGVTGTGKTYTIFGTKEAPGLLPRICTALADHLQRHSKPEVRTEQEISILEIYNEKIHDLLAERNNKGQLQNLRIREHPNMGPYVEGLSKVQINEMTRLDAIIAQGIANRKTAENEVHLRSSRSHVICTIYYHETTSESNYHKDFTSKLSLIDLAGSEKAHRTANFQRFDEGRKINLSLSSLSTVISRLADKSQKDNPDADVITNSSHSTVNSTRSSRQSGLHSSSSVHIPYRNSKLTWLLSDSLGGNARTTMIATLSPSYLQYQETLNTLRYAQQAKLIVNQPKLNMDTSALYI
ncbi:hypothetical protein CRM22_004199, partial [Opisthorchis felineus]